MHQCKARLCKLMVTFVSCSRKIFIIILCIWAALMCVHVASRWFRIWSSLASCYLPFCHLVYLNRCPVCWSNNDLNLRWFSLIRGHFDIWLGGGNQTTNPSPMVGVQLLSTLSHSRPFTRSWRLQGWKSTEILWKRLKLSLQLREHFPHMSSFWDTLIVQEVLGLLDLSFGF